MPMPGFNWRQRLRCAQRFWPCAMHCGTAIWSDWCRFASPPTAIVADDWHGEFGSYDEWARLGPQSPYRTATFFDARGRRCITQHDFARARDDRAFPLRYRWERTEPRK